MSLDEAPMNDAPSVELTRTQLSEKELKASAKIAKEKKNMGLPLSDSERMSLKTARLITDIREEKS